MPTDHGHRMVRHPQIPRRRHFGWTFRGPSRVEAFKPGGDSKPGALVMCDIPLDLERRFERRWAARFSGLAKELALKGQQQHQRVHHARQKQKKNPAG